MMVVLVSTSDPGLEIFPTHRLFRGHEDALPPAGVGDSLRRPPRSSASPGCPTTEAHAVGYRRGSTFPVVGEPGELDVELVDRLVGHEGLGYTADLGEASRGSTRASSTAPSCSARRGSRTSSSVPGAAR